MFIDKIFKADNHNDNVYLPYMGGRVIGGLAVGLANAAINSGNGNSISNDENIILDLETGELITFDNPIIQKLLSKDDNDLLEYRFHKKKANLIKVIQKLNIIYYNQSQQH